MQVNNMEITVINCKTHGKDICDHTPINMIEVYDNGGKSIDRYTIFLDETDDCIGADDRGMGFYQHSTAVRGKHLGKLIPVESLSAELQEKLAYELVEAE